MMTKIKILFALIILLLIIYLLHFTSYIFLIDYYSELENATKDQLVFGKYNSALNLLQSVIIFMGLLISCKCLYQIIKHGFFTSTSKKLMHSAGVIFLFSGVLAGSLDTLRMVYSQSETMLIGIILIDFILALIGFILLIIADMAQTGYQLKSENDLTI